MSLEVIVAGCGPAGMMAAIIAAQAGAKVTVLEGMERPGKKLLLTGNGRCNLTNLAPGLPQAYRSVEEGGGRAAAQVLEQFSVADTLEFFHALGLFTYDRASYVYPRTGQADSVLELLLARMRQLKIKLKYSEKIRSIRRLADGNGWQVTTETWSYSCHRLILCCGSKAAPATGSEGSGYELARQAGHSLTPILPALTALKGKSGRFLSACAGVRTPARVSLYGAGGEAGHTGGREKNDRSSLGILLGEDTGELQISESGISGIVAFQVSRYASLELARGNRVTAVLDFLPERSEEELEAWLKDQKQRWSGADASVSAMLSGLLGAKLRGALLKEANIKPGIRAENLTEEQIHRLAGIIKGFSIPITGTRDFDQCQVCAGGVRLKEINPQTLESSISPGLYFAGEILDVDGPCGGYNLQWAWSSGYVAGHWAGREQAT